jgi:uncharacterized protein
MSATVDAETGLSVVLDTNVALDLLAFRDARVAALLAGVEHSEIAWLASAYMRSELHDVMRRATFARYRFDIEEALAAFDRHARVLPEPAVSPVLRCRDPADQVFLDLALASRAHWLITHDRDLLSLARHAARRGLSILTLMAWAAERSGAPPRA